MLNYPTTPEEAETWRYGMWEGKPEGVLYNPKKCAVAVTSDDFGHVSTSGLKIPYQCLSKPGYGPHGMFCGEHARMIDLALRFARQDTNDTAGTELVQLLAEKTALERMIANEPAASVVDRMSLEARKAKVEEAIAKLRNGDAPMTDYGDKTLERSQMDLLNALPKMLDDLETTALSACHKAINAREMSDLLTTIHLMRKVLQTVSSAARKRLEEKK